MQNNLLHIDLVFFDKSSIHYDEIDDNLDDNNINHHTDVDHQNFAKTQKYELTPIMKQYSELKDNHKDCFLFFRLGDFYELFFEDAVSASQLLDLTLTQRDKSRGGIPMCGMPAHASDTYIAKLIKLGYKVAICEQLESPNKQTKGPIKRQVVRIITQGTATEDMLLEPREYNFILCIAKGYGKSINDLGLAFVDISIGDLFLESVDYSTLLSSLLRMQPKEVLVSTSLFENEEFQSCMKNWKLDWRHFVRSTSDQLFNYENAYKTIIDFYEVKTIDGFGYFSKNEISACGMLFDYIRMTQIDKFPYISAPIKISKDEFIEMDSFTRHGLDIISTTSVLKNATLLSILDHTTTSGGSRMMKMYLSSPLRNIDKINDRLDAVEFFIKNPIISSSIKEIMKKIPDLSRILSKICIGRWSLKDIAGLKLALQEIRNIYDCFFIKNNDSHKSLLDIMISQQSESYHQLLNNLSSHNPANHSHHIPNLLQTIISHLYDYTEFCNNFMNNIKIQDVPLTLNDGDFILPGYDNKLDEARKLRDDAQVFIQELQGKYIKESTITSLKIKKNNIIGYYIEIPQSQEMKAMHSFIRRQSTANAIRYVTEELSLIQENIEDAAMQAHEIENNIVMQIIKEIIKIQKNIHATANAISELDAIMSLATAAQKFNYTRPIINTSEDLIIKNGRHPIIETFLYKSGESFVPNDCILKNNDKIWLLTGPNMAGKSTFLRQNALIIIMAQIGSFVSADYAEIGCVDKIFSRIGASDDISRGRSTFMVEMIETAIILRNAGPRSFVILDEIGRGTSTSDGISIAVASIERLLSQNKCRTLFATHYHEITNMVNVPSYNMKINYDNGKITFMHKIQQGIGQSHGLYVAELAGIPSDVISRAKEILSKLENYKGQKK